MRRAIFRQTYPVLRERRGTRDDGYIGAAVWWTLEDYTTMAPGIALERFGLYRPDGSQRRAAAAAADLFAASAGAGAAQGIESDIRRAEAFTDGDELDLRLVGYLAYGIAVSIGVLFSVLLLLVRLGGRSVTRPGRIEQ